MQVNTFVQIPLDLAAFSFLAHQKIQHHPQKKKRRKSSHRCIHACMYACRCVEHALCAKTNRKQLCSQMSVAPNSHLLEYVDVHGQPPWLATARRASKATGDIEAMTVLQKLSAVPSTLLTRGFQSPINIPAPPGSATDSARRST